MFTLIYAKDPIYNSEDNQQVLLTVRFQEINEDLPFNATSFDSEPHGVDLSNRAIAGEFGEILPYPMPKISETQPNTIGTQNA